MLFSSASRRTSGDRMWLRGPRPASASASAVGEPTVADSAGSDSAGSDSADSDLARSDSADSDSADSADSDSADSDSATGGPSPAPAGADGCSPASAADADDEADP